MITPGFSLTATERVLPRLALDFTTASLDPRVTVTRTTGASNPATYVNSSGFVTDATNNQPRFDFSPTALSCRGLLIEESRANLLTQSSGYGAAVWVKSNISINSTTETSPSGAANATLFRETAVTNTHTLQYTNGTTIGQNQTLSFFVKAAGRTRVAIGDGGINRSIYELVGAGSVVATGAGSTPGITAYGSDWYRITDTRTWASATPYLFLVESGTTVSYLGDITKGIYVWGAQLEAGAFATSYIPTTTTSLTRNADVVTMTGTNFSDWWQATTGSVAARAVPTTVNGVRPLVQFDDNTADNIIALQGNTTNPELYIKATTDQAQIDAGTISANTIYMLASAWNTDNCAAAVNGGGVATDTSATIPTVTQARLGNNGTNYLNGRLQTVRFWPQRITDAEIRAFSKL
jgi:hypothetical protein